MQVKLLIYTVCFLFVLKPVLGNDIGDEVDNPLELFKIEGKAINQFTTDESWVNKARVVVEGGLYNGFLK